MCGIAGIFAHHYAANPIDRGELVRIRDHMAVRGPDGKGEWVAQGSRIGLAHRRLSIIDLTESGAQPMASACGSLVVTFNGEIYNYRELRQALEAKGRVFVSQSDTEVLLHLYAEKGAAMLGDLRGMFAFGLWDAQRQQLLLARDPYGIKPLYYADDGWTLRFASQVKALLAGGQISRGADPAGLVGYYLFGNVPDPHTTYRAVRAVPAGAFVRVDRLGAHRPEEYHSLAVACCEAEEAGRHADPLQRQERVRAALLDSVRHHLVADVPVGAFLSAGIDSGALVGLMRDAGQAEIQTVTIAFNEFQGQSEDEAPLAAEVARLYGTQHSTRVVTEAEFAADLPRIMEAMDQPSIDGINTWFVAKAARERGLKVAVSGVGGDELFGGYPSFRDIPRWVRWLAVPSRVPLLGSSLRRAMTSAFAPRSLSGHPKMAGLLELGGSYAGAYLLRRGLFMPWELDQVLDRDVVREGLRRLCPLHAIAAELRPSPRSAFGKVAVLESSLYMRNQLLRDTDWAGMAHSLEVRTPLVDATLLSKVMPEIVAAPATDGHKSLLGLSPSCPLPAAIAGRKKTGFGTPVAQWIGARAAARRPALPSFGSQMPWARRWAVLLAEAHA